MNDIHMKILVLAQALFWGTGHFNHLPIFGSHIMWHANRAKPVRGIKQLITQ